MRWICSRPVSRAVSITGAIEAPLMQIIDELELVREVYCGSVIRLGFDGNLDSSITIRTPLMRGDEVCYWAGGGIVADPACAAEYQESLSTRRRPSSDCLLASAERCSGRRPASGRLTGAESPRGLLPGRRGRWSIGVLLVQRS